MNEYYANIELPVYSDCNFNATVTKYLPEKTIFKSDETIGGVWFKVSSGYYKGWIYGYTAEGDLLLEDGYKLGVNYFTVGEQITIPSDTNYVHDMYNNTLVVKSNDGSPLYFAIKDVAIEPDRVRIVDKNTSYWFSTDSIEHINTINNGGFMLLSDDGSSSSSGSMASVSTGTSTANRNNATSGDTMDQQKTNLRTGTGITRLVEDWMYKAEKIIGLTAAEKKAAQDTYIESIDQNFRLDDISTIFGAPYQFLPIADLRTNNSVSTNDIKMPGVKYGEKILSKMPLLVLAPGTATFLQDYSDDEKNAVFKTLLGEKANEADSEVLDQLLNKSGKYYDFSPAWDKYYNYVTPMCRVAAVLMGIGDEVLQYPTGGSDPLKNYNWANNKNAALEESLNYKNAVCFYLNSETSVSESFGNNTTQPSLASKINQISDQMRELLFMAGEMGEAHTTSDLPEDRKTKMLTRQNSRGDNALTNVLGSIAAVMQGGKMMFPDLWSDSDFSRSYSIQIKLVSPDVDPLSLYLNIVVPILHLTALVAPRAVDVNTYTSPFLVRAYYKGFMNINMGIITNMSINKGEEGAWSYEGIPTKVDISLDIKDLWSKMAVMNNEFGDNTSNKGLLASIQTYVGLDILANTTLMDYISNLCGVNINEPSIQRSITLYKAILGRDLLVDRVNAIGNTLNRWIYQKMAEVAKIENWLK